MLRTLLLFPILFFVTITAHAEQKNETQDNPYLAALPNWQVVLNTYVDNEGRVDFIGLSKNTEQLDIFVKAVGQVSPDSTPDLFPRSQDIMAYHLNTYNALAMKGVIDRGIPNNFSTLWKRASFFKFRKVVIGGKKTDLYTYENKVIRPIGEARAHFALNCMVKDCPRLPMDVFHADSLESDLQAASIEFFNKDKHIKIDPVAKEVHLSGIMKFYTKDYVASGKKEDLIAYVNQFRDQAIPSDYKVKFIKYDWTVNQQPLSIVKR